MASPRRDRPDVTLTWAQAEALRRLLDAPTVREMAKARDALRRALNIPPFALKEEVR